MPPYWLLVYKALTILTTIFIRSYLQGFFLASIKEGASECTYRDLHYLLTKTSLPTTWLILHLMPISTSWFCCMRKYSSTSLINTKNTHDVGIAIQLFMFLFILYESLFYFIIDISIVSYIELNNFCLTLFLPVKANFILNMSCVI